MPIRAVQVAPILALMAMFRMKGHETQIFQLLLKKPMTMKELEKSSHMSERMLRNYLDDLTKRNLVSKTVVADKRLKYAYYANPRTILRVVKNIMERIEEGRVKMKNEIVRGSEIFTEWRR